MKLSQIHIPTLKETPSDAKTASHIFMLRSGLIRQIESGLYTIMPLGVRVLRKISDIIRAEFDKIGASEVIFPVIQNNEAWKRSGRSDGYCGQETLRMKDRHGNDMLFSPTAEESAQLIFEMDVKSYKQLPITLYQINTKFRDEIRPRFGLMRCREFLMMDAYSFDVDEASAIKTYDKFFKAYLAIFKKIGLTAIPMQANSGEIGGDLSHEFHVVAKTGESGIFYDKKLDELSQNANFSYEDLKNVYAKTEDEHSADSCDLNGEDLVEARGIEVGHIFYYADKYSKAMKIEIESSEGRKMNPIGGCYGIGVTRLMAAFIEANHDEKGVIWSRAVAPFLVNLINLSPKNQEVTTACDALYDSLMKARIEVLYDDKDGSVGQKLNNADLIGLPFQIIIGQKSLESSIFEVKNRLTGVVTKLDSGRFDLLLDLLNE